MIPARIATVLIPAFSVSPILQPLPCKTWEHCDYLSWRSAPSALRYGCFIVTCLISDKSTYLNKKKHKKDRNINHSTCTWSLLNCNIVWLIPAFSFSHSAGSGITIWPPYDITPFLHTNDMFTFFDTNTLIHFLQTNKLVTSDLCFCLSFDKHHYWTLWDN